ncbi:MAG TPA: efflux RND transporter periplasmic adaptor subunit [Phycisphaerae bacterium]|nr:efflux RND transporter periplasmic adaptor subunit [Phycisphaerae bacterium]
MNDLRKSGILLATAAGLLAAGAALAQVPSPHPAPGPTPLPSAVAPLSDSSGLGDAGSSDVGSFKIVNGMMMIKGQTQPFARVEVPSVIHGQLSEVDVKEGDAIKKDQVIARLDDTLQKLAVQSAQLAAQNDAEVRLAQAQIDYAKNDLQRVQGAGTGANETERRQKQLAVTQAEISLDYQKAKQAAAQLELQKQQATLDQMTIRSPLDGMVLRVNKHAGEQTDENPVAIIVQTTKLHAVFFLPRSLFGHVSRGEKVMLTLQTDPPMQAPALITSVDPAVDPAGLFQVKMEIDNSAGKIPAGTPATWARAVGPATQPVAEQ